MSLLALSITGVLIVIAAFHLMPINDETALARAVIGSHEVTRMPGAVSCATVTGIVFFAAILPHLMWFPARSLLMTFIALVFIARGLAAFLPGWRRLTPEEPFASLDRA